MREREGAINGFGRRKVEAAISAGEYYTQLKPSKNQHLYCIMSTVVYGVCIPIYAYVN